MKSLEIKAYEIFKQKLGEAEAATIIEFIEDKADEKKIPKRISFFPKKIKQI